MNPVEITVAGRADVPTAAPRPPARKPVDLRDDKVHAEAVEINVAWHCNISCRSCSHGSPSMPTRFADPGQVERDLALLARWLSVDHVRILGGEPLLHPELVPILRAVERSGLGARRRLLTNGLRLADQPAEFWSEIEEVHVSVYPNTSRYLSRHRQSVARAAEISATTLVFKHFDHFRVAFRPSEQHPELTQVVYETCQVGNRWRCITVEAGRVHRCPQDALLAAEHASADHDALEIAAIGSAKAFRSWLLREEALDSCRRCTGSAGLRHPHRARSAAGDDVGGDAIDHAYLARLQADPDADNGCVTTEESL